MRWISSRPVLALCAAILFITVSACTPQEQEQQPTTPETTQEEPTATASYTADLQPAKGATTEATGSATVEIQGDTATFEVTVQNLSDVDQAHIHVAEQPGAEGPPAVWLYPAVEAREPQVKQGVTSGQLSSGTFQASDFVGPLEGMTVNDLILAIDEGRAYVNVHTTGYPAGEITGPLGQ